MTAFALLVSAKSIEAVIEGKKECGWNVLV